MTTTLERLDHPKSDARKAFRIIAVVSIALAGLLVIAAGGDPAAKDYIEYWSSGKLLLQHVDPYFPVHVFALEKAHGFLPVKPLVMLNPPWTMFLVAPLGLLNPAAGLVLWMIAVAGCILISIRLLNLPSKDAALAFAFAPALASICSGQSSPFLLLGFSLFLYFHRSRPFLAGASLLLMAIKPHLFLVFWAVLLVDCIYRRTFPILIGGAAALAAATAFSMCFDLHIWPHYIAILRGYKLQRGFLPTASMLFRMLLDVRAFWLLFVPSIVAILWGFWYYSRWKHAWDWRIHGMLLMVVTIFASPYGFFSDEIVLLPSIVFALAFVPRRKFSALILLAINTVALCIVMIAGAQLSSAAYIWTPAAWLAWFLYATHKPAHSQDPLVQSPAGEIAKAEV